MIFNKNYLKKIKINRIGPSMEFPIPTLPHLILFIFRWG